jgi:putative endonuclease
MSEWHLYIVRCQNDALYTGITTNITDRVKKHNSKMGSKSVIGHGLPVELVYTEKIGNYGDALRREAAIKKLTKTEKEKLISSFPME